VSCRILNFIHTFVESRLAAIKEKSKTPELAKLRTIEAIYTCKKEKISCFVKFGVVFAYAAVGHFHIVQ